MCDIYNEITSLFVSLTLEANIPMLHPHLHGLMVWIYVIFKNIHTRLPLTQTDQWQQILDLETNVNVGVVGALY